MNRVSTESTKVVAAASFSRGHMAGVRALVLCGLVLLAFRETVQDVATAAWQAPEAVHVFLAPLLIAVLLWARRGSLRAAAGDGSILALALLGASLLVERLGLLHSGPEYIRHVAIVPALAWAIGSAAGWRAVRLCIPALLLVMLAIPPGSPYLPFFFVTDDPVPLRLIQPVVAMVTQLPVEIRGVELYFQPLASGDFTPMTAINERTGEALLLLGYLSAAVFVASRRPWGAAGVAIIAALALPVAMLAHMFRNVVWTAAIVHGKDQMWWFSARWVSAAAALVLAFALLRAVAARIGGPAERVPSK